MIISSECNGISYTSLDSTAIYEDSIKPVCDGVVIDSESDGNTSSIAFPETSVHIMDVEAFQFDVVCGSKIFKVDIYTRSVA